MKKNLLLMVMIPLSLSLFIECQNPDGGVESNSSGDIVKKVFLGGSILVDPEQPDINQLLPGMKIPIRMARYGQASDGSPIQIADSVKYGSLDIQIVDYEYLVFTLTLKSNTNTVIIKNVKVTLEAGSLYDIDKDGFYDITYQKSDRGNAMKTMYLTFISSAADSYTTMYQLLPEYFPGGYYPSGLAGISPSGRLIIMQSDAQGVLSASLTSLLRDGDMIIDTAGVANEGRVKEISGAQEAIQGPGYSYVILPDKDLMQKAYELCYIDAHGLASELNNSGPAARSRATFDIGDITQSVSTVINDVVSVVGSITINLDFYIDVSIETFFVGVEVRASMYAIAKTKFTGKIQISKNLAPSSESWNDIKILTIKHFRLPITVGGVPVELGCPIEIYMDITPKAKFSFSFSEENKTRIGFENFHSKAWMELFGPRFYVDLPKPVIDNSSRLNPPEILADGEIAAFFYVKLSPEIAPCYMAHIKSPIKTGIEVKGSAGIGTEQGPIVKVEVFFATKLGIITASLGFAGIELDLGKIDLNIQYRLKLWDYILYQTPEPTPLPTPPPNTKTLSVFKEGTGIGTVTTIPEGIVCSGDGTWNWAFTFEEYVTLTAVPNSSSTFGGWSGDARGTDYTCSLTMDSTKSVTAKFEAIPSYNLSVSKAGTGGGLVISSQPPGLINCGGNCTWTFTEGDVVTLTAVADLDSYFVGWSGAASGTDYNCSLTMDSTKSVTAIFNTIPTLSVSRAGTGGGKVTSEPAGIVCGSNCKYPFTPGELVTLTAVADAGSYFVGWSGDASGTGDYELTMDAPKSVTAVFDTVPLVQLVVVAEGMGSGNVVSTPAGINWAIGEYTAYFTQGTTVTLTATAKSGSTFAGWSGGASGTGTNCQVTMNAAKSVTATFNPNPVLSISRAGTGSGTVASSPSGINCGSTCSTTFSPGTVVTLTATADSGSTFAGWSGAASGTGTTCQVTMNAAKSVTATFNTNPVYRLSLYVAGTGGGTIISSPAGINCGGTCSAYFPAGTIVTLTAMPGSTSYFAGWSGAGSGTGTSCRVTIDKAKSVTAIFYTTTLSVTVNNAGGGGSVTSSPSGINCSSSCSATFTRGTIVTLTATPNASSRFAGWSGAASGTSTTCNVTIDKAKSVTAVFTP